MSERGELDNGARAVAADLDGVLLDGMRFHIAAWQDALVGYIDVEPYELYLLEGIKSREVVDRLCEKYELSLSTAERASIARRKKEIYRAIFEPIPLSGARSLLETCSCYGYRIAVVTGTITDAVTSTLRQLGMLEQIKHIISADLDIPGKPDPAPFREAQRLLGVASENCLAVDNAPAGIASAVQAGIPCAGVATYLPRGELAAADAVFDSVEALVSWLREEHDTSEGKGMWCL